ncbi:hypothetical protein [Undibacterium sp. TC9W]|uniref:hypothetical protein n=1 Tax=Undibacterium sp. TC9W TaxID=3413053 RepID=UPI003BF48301
MFYLQALMFVDYLKANNHTAFSKALHDIAIGKDFPEQSQVGLQGIGCVILARIYRVSRLHHVAGRRR